MSSMTGADAAPGFDHSKIFDRITVAPAGKRLRAVFAGQVIADSARALVLEEDGYPPRVYFPPQDLRREYLESTDRSSHCPWKGDAAYWTVTVGERSLENGAWAYPEPPEEMAAIANHVSFYDEVTIKS